MQKGIEFFAGLCYDNDSVKMQTQARGKRKASHREYESLPHPFVQAVNSQRVFTKKLI